MASPYILKKFYSNFKGLDLRSPDISQNPDAATSMINGMFRQTGSLSKRKGYQIASAVTKGGYGATTFENVNSSGIATEEFITIDQNLFKLSEDSFTITYAPGDSSSGRYDLYYDSTDSTFYFDLYDGSSTRVMHYSLGNGYSGTNRSVADLKTNIDLVTAFSATAASTATAQNAAFIPVARNGVLADGSAATLTFKHYEQIDCPSTYTNPFSAFYATRTSTSFENATFAQLKKVLYISTGFDALHKYDGLRVYKAGLPIGTTPTGGAGSGGSLIAGAYKWKYTYYYKDAKGNEIESTPTATLSFTSAGTDSRAITVANLQETSGYNTSQAVVNGAQSGVNTITVDSGYTLKVGDYVYLQDGVTSSVVSRKVTALNSATTLTIDGAAVNVADNAVISPIEIILYRTNSGGSIFYMSKELINDTDNNTQAYDDGTADASLGFEFLEPIKPHGLPVTGKYITAWRQQLVISGNTSNTNTVYYSDIESPEYFPPADNSFNVTNTVNGIRELDNTFFVFKEKSIDAVSGDFGIDQFEVDNISNEGIGCLAHATIQEVNKQLWFLSKDGVYSISQNGLIEVSAPIKNRFVKNGLNNKQAIAFNRSQTTQYILMLPSLPTNPTGASDTLSKIYVYNYFDRHNAWHEWSNFNFIGGISVLGDDLFLVRRNNSYIHTLRVQDTGLVDDYLDHDQAISFEYKTHWETVGEPAVYKKFNRLKIYSLDPTIDDFEGNGFDLTVTVYGNFLNIALGTASLDFSGGSVGWGMFEWGAVPWGEIMLPDLGTKLAAKKFKSQQLKFTNSEFHQNVLLSSYELEIAAPYQANIKD